MRQKKKAVSTNFLIIAALDAELLAAGDKEKSNAMTIGWGGIGTLWGRTALTVYVAPFDPQYFKSDAPKKMYANFPAGIHSMYIGEVINAWKKSIKQL